MKNPETYGLTARTTTRREGSEKVSETWLHLVNGARYGKWDDLKQCVVEFDKAFAPARGK